MRPLPTAVALLFLFTVATAAAAATATTTPSQELERLLSGYDKVLRPSAWEAQQLGEAFAPPEQVEVQMYVESIPYIHQLTQTYGLNGYMRLWWREPRLSDANRTSNLVFTANDGLAPRLWLPDLYFELAESVHFAAPGAEGESIVVKPDGGIWWSRQARLRLRCCMEFRRMPFDTQRCPVRMGSYANSASEIELRWKPEALPGVIGLHRDTWEVTGALQRDKIDVYATYNYSHVEGFVDLERSPTSYLYFILLPLVMVLLSYLGFWINPAATPARVTLGVISILTVVTNLLSLRSTLPPLPYFTWLEELAIGSLAFNLCAFVEQVAVNVGLKAQAAYDADAADGVVDGLVSKPRTRFARRGSVVEEKDEEERAAELQKQQLRRLQAEREPLAGGSSKSFVRADATNSTAAAATDPGAATTASANGTEQQCGAATTAVVTDGGGGSLLGVPPPPKPTAASFSLPAASCSPMATAALPQPSRVTVRASAHLPVPPLRPLAPPIHTHSSRVAPAPILPPPPPSAPPSPSAPSYDATSTRPSTIRQLSMSFSSAMTEVSVTMSDSGRRKEALYKLSTCSHLAMYYRLRYLRVLDYACRWFYPLLVCIFVASIFASIPMHPVGATGDDPSSLVANTC